MNELARIKTVIIAFGLLGALIVGRLFEISIVDHAGLIAEAAKQQTDARDILPQRGGIFVQDRAANSTVAVAESIESYAFSAVPYYMEDPEGYARLLANHLNLDSEELLKKFSSNKKYIDPIVHGLTYDQAQALVDTINTYERAQNNGKWKDRSVNFDKSQGSILNFINNTFFIREYTRVYPEESLMGQLLGYVNSNGGQYGFEGQFDKELKGYPGRVELEQDSAGNALSRSQQVSGQDGISYELTIDRNIQGFIEQALQAEVTKSEAKAGTVIVVDPRNGDILGMASTPGYNPNSYSAVAKQDISLFDNPAISKQWEPGSIFKPLVMAAAIDQGVVTPETTDTFASSVTVDGYEINTALGKSFGKESMTDVIVNSDNVAMVWLANKMGNEMIASYLDKYGFGKQTGIDLRYEIAGTVKQVAKWRPIDRATVAFGQGIAVTPLQVATAYTAIANTDGSMREPHLIKAVIQPDGHREELAPRTAVPVLKSDTASKVRAMLVATVEHNHRRAGVDGYVLGGKTGTAQVPNPNGPGYLENTYNHSFVGMGPADNPQFLVLTKIDQPNLAKVGNFAESTAVPLFSTVANFLLNYLQIPPSK